MINAFYAKSIENLRSPINLDLIDKTDIQLINFRLSRITSNDEIGDCGKFIFFHVMRKILFQLNVVFCL